MAAEINEGFIKRAVRQIAADKVINRRLAPNGKIKIEGLRPFLIVYRIPPIPDHQTAKLLTGESALLMVPAEADNTDQVSELIQSIGKQIAKDLGGYLVLEVWAGDEDSRNFILHTPEKEAPSIVENMREGLDEMANTFDLEPTDVQHDNYRHPEGVPPLLTIDQCKEEGILLLGLEIPPIYRDIEKKHRYPLLLRRMKKSLSTLLRKSFYEFIRVHTHLDLSSHHILGSRRLEPAVWHVDRQLANIEDQFSFLLLISPTNTMEAKEEFFKSGRKKNPEFLYRVLPADPDHMKEKLYRINISKINDPTLAYLFREKREELDKQVTMLRERGTIDFMYSSIRLYKAVDPHLLKQAEELLREVQPKRIKKEPLADCHVLAQHAREEIEYYKKMYPKLDAKVEIKSDVIGIMVSKGQLLIGESFSTTMSRVRPLIQHEVGTHVLTFYNGKAQPLRQLSNGLADYDELQEGLAVLSEYLVGGLSDYRLRILAARVVAAHCLTEGADFAETFHVLHDKYNMGEDTAFGISARIHQGGGCTKDIIYLRGLIQLLDHLKKGGELEPLFIGKISEKHITVMKELQDRKILKPMPMIPRYLSEPEAKERLKKVREGIRLKDLIN